MDIPSYPATTIPYTPPPSYNEINPLGIYQGFSGKPPPAYTETPVPPTDMIQQHANLYPSTAQADQFPVLMPRVLNHREQVDGAQYLQHANLYPSRTQVHQFPVLMPRVEVVNHTEQVFVHQQFVRNDASQVIVVQPQQILLALGDTPTATVCKYCQNSILTVVEYKPGCAAWGMCILLSMLGLVCGFCLIPFCVRGFQDAHHYCPHCHSHIGIYRHK